MSIDRCIEALVSLEDDLDRVLHTPDSQSPEEQQDALDDLIRNLTLDIDLRSNGVSTGLMTDVESHVYLPAIEKILALLVVDSPKFSDSLRARRAEAKELAGNALRQANALKF